MIQRISCTINHNLPNYVKNYFKKTFLAQTVRIQLVTPQTARLSIFLQENQNVGPPRGI